MNVGVHGNFRTKKALKDAVKAGKDVFVYPTSPFFEGFEDRMRVVVVGPDPYTKRNWYATVEVDKTGRIRRVVR